jgi:hypothetical protein
MRDSPVRVFALSALLLVAPFSRFTLGQVSGTSAPCGQIDGKTAKDIRNVETFCAQRITKDSVVGAYAMESLLRLKVSRPIADQMETDALKTSKLLQTWITAWKQISGSNSVTIKVESGYNEIAKGETKILSGNEVTAITIPVIPTPVTR